MSKLNKASIQTRGTMNNPVDVDALAFSATAHPAGTKKVLFAGSECASNLTQFAYGKLPGGEAIPSHRHPTMEEFFYFLSGEGSYEIDGVHFPVRKGIALHIPAGSYHTLQAQETLEFLYFGVAL